MKDRVRVVASDSVVVHHIHCMDSFWKSFLWKRKSHTSLSGSGSLCSVRWEVSFTQKELLSLGTVDTIFFHLKKLKPCKFHEIWCETPFQITPALILVLAQTVMVDCDQRQRKQVRKHNTGYPLALHQNKLTANKVGNSKTLENSNFIWNRHILFLFVGQKRDSELPSCVRFLLAPFTESLISPTCRSQTIMIPETGLRMP